MTIDEILDDVEYYISDPAKWINYSDKRRSELKMMIEELISQNSGKPLVSGRSEQLICSCSEDEICGICHRSKGYQVIDGKLTKAN